MATLIFGILNIGFGFMKLAGLMLAAAMMRLKLHHNPGLEALKSDPAFAAWTRFSMEAGVVLGVALLVFGVGLLLLQNWARIGSIVYAIVDIVFVVVGGVVSLPMTQRMAQQMGNAPPGMMAGFATIGLVIGLVLGLVYPALLLFFMTRPHVIEACQPEQPAPEA
jgi:hypothetical protein